VKSEKILERVYEPRRLLWAWQQVRSNAGAAGIDKMTVEAFERKRIYCCNLSTRSSRAEHTVFDLPDGIDTEGRNLEDAETGIPVVIDRIVSQSTNLVFEEIFDPDFTESSFGFRRGRSQHQAIEHIREMVKRGYEWCASIDLQSFFDEIPHDLILKLIRRKIADERLVTLIARALKAGVVDNGVFEKTTKGVRKVSPFANAIEYCLK